MRPAASKTVGSAVVSSTIDERERADNKKKQVFLHTLPSNPRVNGTCYDAWSLKLSLELIPHPHDQP